MTDDDHRDGLRVVFLDHGLPELEDVLPGSTERWERWLMQHGLPTPKSIPLDSKIVCDDVARTVSCEVYLTDSDGRKVVAWDGSTLVRRTVSVQLEAPPLPLPEPVGYTTYRTHGCSR